MESENTWKNESSDTSENTSQNSKCPESPRPSEFKKYFEPTPMPSKEYYEKKVPEEQLGLIDGIKTKEVIAASEKESDDMVLAEDAYQSAKDAFAKAGRDKENAIKSLNTKSENKKTDLLRVHNEKLVALVPKGCSPAGKEASSLKDKVPPDKLAKSIAELEKATADEDLDYLKKLKDINLKVADAENLWKKADITYNSAICEANFTKEQAVKQAEVAWRTSLSKLLDQYK